MNAGLLVDLPQLSESGASGIGLFRTELQFMIASTMPKADEQETLYRNVLRQAGGRPVTFRTLDIGGDKVVPYFRSRRRGKSGAGLAGHPAVAGPARPCCAPSFARC
jgi:phosphotransferase system enzyme I (PtsP)